MKILILGASGFLGGKVYWKLKENPSFETKETCFKTHKNNELIQINIENEDNIKELLFKYNPNVVIWCLFDMNNVKKLTNIGLPNILTNIEATTKFIYISTDAFSEGKGNYSEETSLTYYINKNTLSDYINAKITGEEIVKHHKNHVIIRTGPLYGKDIDNKWDKRTSTLIDSLSQNKILYRSSNLYKTFVNVDDLSDLICEIISTQFVGIIHAGSEQKESYYTFNKKMARKLGLNDNLIIEDIISIENAIDNGLPLDTSMNTLKCRMNFRTKFSNV